MRASGFSRARRRIAWRLLLSPSAVTVQVLTTHKSADSSSAASRKFARKKPSRTSSVSYRLTLQPSVSVLSVAGIGLFRGRLERRAHGPLAAVDVLIGPVRMNLVAF